MASLDDAVNAEFSGGLGAAVSAEFSGLDAAVAEEFAVPKARPPFGFAPGKELDPEGFGQRDESQFRPDFRGDPSLPKAKVRDVPEITGRALTRARLGTAKAVLGTFDAMLNIPEENIHKVGTPWAPSQFALSSKEKRERTAPIREARRKVMSAQKKFGRKYSGSLAWGVNVISEAAVYMGDALAGGVVAGPAGAAMVGFVIEGDSAAEDAITSIMRNRKLTRSQIYAKPELMEQVERERVVVGSLNAIIEAVQIGRVMKFAKSGKHSLKNFVKLARTKGIKHAGKELKGWTGEVARLSIEEALEEFSQEGVSLSVPTIFRGEYPRKEDGTPDWLAIGERLGEAALGGAVAGPVLGGAGRLISGVGTEAAEVEQEIPTDIPPGSNVYRTAEKRVVIETPADIGTEQGTELRDGRVYERATGEELFQVKEGTVSGRQDAPKTDQVPDFPVTEAEIIAGDITTTMGKSAGLGRAVQSLVDEGMSFEDAQTVIRGAQEGGKTTEEITESKEMRDQLLKVQRAIEPDEQNPAKVEQQDKLTEPEFGEPGTISKFFTSKRILMQRIGADRLTGPLLAAKEKMEVIKGTLNKEVNKITRALRKRASFGDRVASRIMKRQTKPVRRMVELLDTYERLPEHLAKELSSVEVESFNKLRDITKWLLERTNIARREAGLDTINDLKAYIPHWVDSVADEIIDGTYIYKSGYLARLMKNVPKHIKNRTAYHRELTRKIQDNMEQDLGRLMKGLISYDLHDMLLTNPQAQVWDELHQLQTDGKIPDNTYNAIAKFINYDILGKQAELDKTFNNSLVVKTSTELINKVLKPLNREVSNPALFYFGGTRKLMHAAFMPFRPRPATRNLGQRLLNLSFFRARDLLRAQFGKQDRINDPETGKQIKILDLVKKQDWYKLTKPEDILNDQTILSRLTSLGMIAFKKAHVGNRYASNVEVSALTAYYDWKYRFVESHNKESKYYKRIVEHNKKTNIPIEQLQTQQEDMMNDIRDGVQMTQWEYMSHSMPTLFRGQTARAVAAYQSWWMNYFMSHTAEGWNRLLTGRTRVRGDGTGGRLLTKGARFRAVKGMGAIYGMARIAKDTIGIAMLGALWMPDPTDGLPPILNLVVIMAHLLLGFGQPEKRKQAWKDLKKHATRLLPFNNAMRDIAKVGDDWTLKDYVFYTENEEWKQIWIPVEPK